MKKISDRRKKRLAEYKARIKDDSYRQQCALCGVNGTKESLERHHPKRRLNGNLLVYEYVCSSCHVEIENHKHPDHLSRDDDHERKFHALKDGENMLKQ